MEGRTTVESAAGAGFVPLKWSVEGMDRSLERFSRIGWNDPVGAFVAISETLWWIGVVDDHLQANHASVYQAMLADEVGATGRLLKGLRFARNRITHVVDQINYAAAAAASPSSLEAVWTWQSLPPRPDLRQMDGYADYQSVLAGRRVRDTLMSASLFLGATFNRAWAKSA